MAHPRLRPGDPLGTVDERVWPGAVDRGGAAIRQVRDGLLQVLPAVQHDAHAHEDRRSGVRPPPAQADAGHADDGRHARLPVRLVHVRVRVQHAVVELLGQLELLVAEDHGPGHGQGHHGHHEPALPHGVPEQVERADGRVLRRHQAQDGVADEDHAHHGQGDGGHEVPHPDGPVRAVGPGPRRGHAGHAQGDEERDRRDQGEQVLDPRGPHGLRGAHHDRHEDDRDHDHPQRRPFEPLGLLDHALDLRGQLRGAEPAPARPRLPGVPPRHRASSAARWSKYASRAVSI